MVSQDTKIIGLKYMGSSMYLTSLCAIGYVLANCCCVRYHKYGEINFDATRIILIDSQFGSLLAYGLGHIYSRLKSYQVTLYAKS